jgi:very-short-patch-repair endonuclease
VHDDPDQAGYDAARTETLKQHGIRVIRVRNEEVQHNIWGVVARIAAAAGGDVDDPRLDR